MMRASHLFAVLLCSLPGIAAAQPRPVIERIEPTSGPPGTVVEIIGRTIHPQSTILLGAVPLENVRALPNRWSVRIPANAQSGFITIRTPFGEFQGPQFRVTAALPPPTVARLDPVQGPPGAEVTIHGTNFSTRPGDNTVLLGALPVVVRSATPTTLAVTIPSGAATGPFTVRVAGAGEVTSPPFTVTVGVTISDFTPRIGPPGTRVTIRGTGFSPATAQNRVYMNNRPVRVERAAVGELIVNIPRTASGPIVVDVRGGGRAETPAPFVIGYPPTMSGFAPPAGPPGTTVTIRGTNFGADIRAVTVTLNGVPVTLRAIRGTELDVEIPQGATSGVFSVRVAGLEPVTGTGTFSVLVPLAIREVVPATGPAGTQVVVRGTGFSTTARDNVVKLSGVTAELVSATATELTIRIPAAASAPIEVTVPNNGTARSPSAFVVTQPPFIASFAPAIAAVGAEVTIRGTNFGTNAAVVEVKLNGLAMPIRSVTNETIVVVVPPNAATGRIEVTVRLQGSAAAATPFQVAPSLRVAGAAPTSGHPGLAIVMRGEGFVAGSTVSFQGVAAAVAATVASPGELRVVVPDGAQTGPLTVRTPDGRTAAWAGPFTVVAVPTGVGITGVEPECTRPGCRVVVRGYGFSASSAQNRVFFGTAPMRVERATPTALTIFLPRSIGTNPIRIDVRRVGVAQTSPFTITSN